MSESLPTPEDALPDLPSFSESGGLPPGDYWPDREEFERVFLSIPSETREVIFDGFLEHQVDLRETRETGQCLLNGSFTTSKPNPGDIDLVVFILSDTGDPNAHWEAFSLLQGPRMKSEYHCDAYPVLVLPKEHPHYETVTLQGIKYWLEFFAVSRSGEKKGRVWTTLGGFLNG